MGASKQVAETIYRGGIVCIPTETVYGLICSTSNGDTIDRLARLKGRPAQKPFALFASSWERMQSEAVEPCRIAEQLGRQFWPGPLTLVVAAKEACPCAYLGSVGVRCPDHNFAQSVLTECGGLLVNTSMNRSGEPEYCSLGGIENFLDKIDLAVDGGVLPKRRPSTVVDCRTVPPSILRIGKITEEMIHKALIAIKID